MASAYVGGHLLCGACLWPLNTGNMTIDKGLETERPEMSAACWNPNCKLQGKQFIVQPAITLKEI